MDESVQAYIDAVDPALAAYASEVTRRRRPDPERSAPRRA
jgi:hypothetical protein